jgi:septal ring factor EnvC (AmiA/AmiB activator)
MALDVLLAEEHPGPPDLPRRRSSRRRGWIVGAVLFALLAALLGYMTGNERQANTQFDQTHQSLDTTRHQIHAALASLATVRHELTLVNGQVADASTALTQDASELKEAQTALANAQVNVVDQTSMISDLQTCLGGVEQALNALAVADQPRAISALTSVSSSCSGAVASNG